MDRYLAIFAILILGAIVLMCGYYSNIMVNREKFDANENENENNENSISNPHRLYLEPIDESCENEFDSKSFVSVQEFMDGKRYKCY
tara:strand:+ start:1174 stop:1434 length:261 start_codon:yes stop_codon:yes gene_type:complete